MKSLYVVLSLILMATFAFVAATAFYAGRQVGIGEASTTNAVANINAPIYGDPNIHGSTVGWVRAGDAVSVQQTQCDFYQIKYVQHNGTVLNGWVENRYILMNSLTGD